jgi:hypothetical protein
MCAGFHIGATGDIGPKSPDLRPEALARAGRKRKKVLKNKGTSLKIEVATDTGRSCRVKS